MWICRARSLAHLELRRRRNLGGIITPVRYNASVRQVFTAAVVMAVGALIGGTLGGRLAGSIKPSTLRWTVIAIGLVVAVSYFIRG